MMISDLNLGKFNKFTFARIESCELDSIQVC